MNLKKMLKVMEAFRAGAPLGDVLVLKFDALQKSSEQLNKRLEKFSGYAPNLHTDELLKMKEGSLGRTYAQHLLDNKLEHLKISNHVIDQMRQNPFAIRYTQTHDLHHVLTGFDTSISGEAGVVGFTVGQGVGPVSQAFLSVLRPSYSLISPSQTKAIWYNINLGLQMGKKAKLLIGHDLESWLNDDIGDTRHRLGIDPNDVKMIKAGGESWFMKLVYPEAK